MEHFLKKTVAEIVTANHQNARVFEKYQIDFCCNGKKSLELACEEKSINPDSILQQLSLNNENTATVTDFNRMPLSLLIDYIIEMHHAYVKENLPIILNYTEKISTKHGGHYHYMKEVHKLFSDLQNELIQHMLKEENILFHRIKKLEAGIQTGQSLNYFTDPIDVMEAEHQLAGNIMDRIRLLTNQYNSPDNSCTTFKVCMSALKQFERDLHQHVHLENNILFPKAIALYDQFKSVANNNDEHAQCAIG